MTTVVQIYPEWLAANERAFFVDASDNVIKVAICRTTPEHDRELRVGVQAFLVDAAGAIQLDASGEQIRSPLITRGIDISGLATNQCSLRSAFWKLWVRMPKDADGMNVDPPASMSPGETLEYDGEVWFAGIGKPAAELGEPGNFYHDQASGKIYRKRPGEAEYFARRAAEQMAERLIQQSELDNSDYPYIETRTASTSTPSTPEEMREARLAEERASE